MKTVAALLLIIGHCALTNGMPSAIEPREAAEHAISKDFADIVNSLGNVPVTGPPKIGKTFINTCLHACDRLSDCYK